MIGYKVHEWKQGNRRPKIYGRRFNIIIMGQERCSTLPVIASSFVVYLLVDVDCVAEEWYDVSELVLLRGTAAEGKDSTSLLCRICQYMQ